MKSGSIDVGSCRPRPGVFNNRNSIACNAHNTRHQNPKQIAIIGGGIAGLATAVALQGRANYSTTVFERSTTRETRGSALGLWTNAWRVLDALDIGDDLRRLHPAIDQVILCNYGKELKRFSLNSDCEGAPHEFRGIKRSNLAELLENKLRPGVVQYDKAVSAVTTSHADGVQVNFADGSSSTFDLVIGSDGIRSSVLSAANRKPANLVGQVAIRGIAAMQSPLCIRQILGTGARAGCYPISSDELYFFVCFNDSAGTQSSSEPTQEQLMEEALQHVKGWQWNIPEAVRSAASLGTLSRSRLADRWDFTVDESKSSLVTLAGDALHPMTPNLGQGGCTALEDALVLASKLSKGGLTVDSLVEYEKERKQRCLPLTIRAHLMGAALQLPLAPVVALRDLVVEKAFSPSHFLDHTKWWPPEV